MKDEEMAEQFADNISGLELTCSLLSAKDKSHAYRLGRYDGFLAGLKAGRPQWHEVADGDYPDTDRTVLAYSDDVVSGHYPYFAQYYKGFTNAKKNGVDLNWNCWRNNMQRELVEPTVWCEIPTFDKE